VDLFALRAYAWGRTMSSAGLELARERRDPSAEELRGPASVREPAAEGRATAAPHKRTGGRGVAASRLLADEQTRMIVRALADGPLRPSQLEALPGIVHGSLYARLAQLTTSGLFATRRFSEFPLRVEYRLSDAGRTVFANELLIERQERRRLAGMGPPADGALGSLLRLLAPVSHPATDRQGRCVLVEHEPSGLTHTVRLLVADRRIVVSELASPVASDMRLSATSEAWENALVAGGTHGLRIAGGLALGEAVMVAFGAALNA
jgi:DNA-binding HxlR family transcriptional regulator